MSENTKIEWCDHTFNGWTGCTKVSPGCANCYAEGWAKRSGIVQWGPGAPRRRTSAANWKLPLKWNRNVSLAKKQPCGCVICTCEDDFQCQGCGSDHCGTHPVGNIPNPQFNRPRVFCSSLSDWLDDEVPIEWLEDLMVLIQATPNLDWLLLTKRPENWRSRINAAFEAVAGNPDAFTIDTAANDLWWYLKTWLDGDTPRNIWIGTTVENQAMAETRIPQLLSIPARVRFLSCEPMLGPVDVTDCALDTYRTVNAFTGRWAWNSLRPHTDGGFAGGNGEGNATVKWIICGGESGNRARPMNQEWARSLRDQCQEFGVPFFFKQMGGLRKPFAPIPDDLFIRQFPHQQRTP